MSERRFSFVSGEYYHIYNRGNSKQVVFQDSYDYVRFQRLLFLSNSSQNFKIEYIRDKKIDFYESNRKEKLVAIGAYCLMPNHFHILLTPLIENGVSVFMKKLGTGYSMYFNKKYDRAGSLFEGKFKAKIAEDDEYLKYLFAYIHLNPLKLIDPEWKEKGVLDAGPSKQYLESYGYSSLSDFLGVSRKEGRILDVHKFPQFFQSKEDVKDNLYSWFSDRKDLSASV